MRSSATPKSCASSTMTCVNGLPLQSRVDEATDEDELNTIFETERHLFYVACTRARDHLHVSGVNPISDFVADMALAE